MLPEKAVSFERHHEAAGQGSCEIVEGYGMSDLISKSKLIKAMNKTEEALEKEMVCPSWWMAYSVIDIQPTAFDPDNVIEKLKNVAKESHGNTGMRGELVVNLDDAIEMVKKGGVTDDVCEWKHFSGGKSPYKPSCESSKFEAVKIGDYCPFCGKKIKVV